MRQNKKRRDHNKSRRSRMRTLVKKVLTTTEKELAEKHLNEAVSYLDRIATKGIIHPKNAARKKSQLTNYVNTL
jgi:small subunit ribosomal protein S20